MGFITKDLRDEEIVKIHVETSHFHVQCGKHTRQEERRPLPHPQANSLPNALSAHAREVRAYERKRLQGKEKTSHS